MSFYDEASWVLIPEGIKEDVVYAQKPTDGLGDLTFTRASDATRTNSAGVIERTPWNLVQFSEDFSDVAWTKTRSTVTANTIAAPNGTLTADTWAGNGTATAKYVLQTASIVSGRAYSVSIYAKKNTNNFIQLFAGTATFGPGAYANFDLNNGVLGTIGAAATATIESVGDGWYRCVVTAISTVTTTNNAHVVSLITSATSPPDEINTLLTSVYIWGAQIVEGTDAKPYFATTNRQDVPRLDYRNADGTLNSCPRLLLEPQRTNSIRNSTMVGAVAGSPGTLPTNWGEVTRGLTRSVVGVGVVNGLQYIDVRYNGTATGTQDLGLDGLSAPIVAALGQTWSFSTYISLQSGTIPTTNLRQIERTAAGVFLTDGNQAISLTSTLQRFTYTRATTNALVERISPLISINTIAATSYDFTIRIAAPQMELGAYATTFIPTTTAAVTRLIDTPILSNATFLPTSYPFTLFADMDIIDTTVGYVLSFSNNAAANNYFAIIYTTNIWSAQSRPNGTTVSADGTFTTARGRHKAAAVFTLNTIKIYVDGVSVATATNTNTFNSSINDLNVGLLRTVTDNGVRTSIFQSAVFNRELTNAELAQITTL